MSRVLSIPRAMQAVMEARAEFVGNLETLRDGYENSEWPPDAAYPAGLTLAIHLINEELEGMIEGKFDDRAYPQDSKRVKVNGRWVRRPASYPSTEPEPPTAKNPPYFE